MSGSRHLKGHEHLLYFSCQRTFLPGLRPDLQAGPVPDVDLPPRCCSDMHQPPWSRKSYGRFCWLQSLGAAALLFALQRKVRLRLAGQAAIDSLKKFLAPTGEKQS